MTLKFLLPLAFLGTFATVVSAQDSELLKSKRYGSWEVSKLQTPTDGVSCQAVKCNTRACDVDSADAVIRLWGSERRRAITPMIGMNSTVSGAKNTTVTIADKSFALAQAKNSRGKLFIAKDPNDDTTIMELIAANPKGTITFMSSKGGAQFRLNGVNKVLAFFKRECGISNP